MPRPQTLEGDTFLNGMQRDAQGEMRVLTLRTLENFDVVRTPIIALKVRPGYARWNATALADVPRQVMVFSWENQATTINGRTDAPMVLLDNGDIYMAAAAAHTQVFAGSANMPNRIPSVSVGDRWFFGTETTVGKGFYWTDPAGLVAGTSYPVGIDALGLSNVSVDSVDRPINDSTTSSLLLDDGTTQRLSQSFAITIPHLIDGWRLRMVQGGSAKGSFRVGIQTDDGSGDPSGTVYQNSDSVRFVSDWIPASAVPDPEDWFDIRIRDTGIGLIEDVTNTLHVVVETDAAYKAEYAATPANKISWAFAVGTNPYAGGTAMNFNGSAWINLTNDDFGVMLGVGLTEGAVYRYHVVGYNTTYGIEGARNDDPLFGSARSGTGRQGIQLSGLGLVALEPQIERVRFYRTTGSPAVVDYFHIADIRKAGLSTIVDCVGDSSLTLNDPAFLVQPFQDANANRLAPKYIAEWNGRLWVAPENRSTLYFSAKVEEENALGQVGESMYDLFPANNTFKFNVGEPITGIVNFDDRLVVTFANHVRVLRGGDSPLNPPPDLYMAEAINTEGSIDGYAMVEVLGALVLVNRHKEVKLFRDGPGMTEVNDANNSLWKVMGDVFEAANVRNQYYVLVRSSSSSTTFDQLWVFDASEQSPRWTKRTYDINFHSLTQLPDGTVLACDTASNYIVQLDTGTDDNGTDITAIAEGAVVFSENPQGGRSFWTELKTSMYHPDTSNFPSITLQGIDRLAKVSGKTITPTGSDGHREHWTSLRVLSEECYAKVQLVGKSNDEIRRIQLLGQSATNLLPQPREGR